MKTCAVVAAVAGFATALEFHRYLPEHTPAHTPAAPVYVPAVPAHEKNHPPPVYGNSSSTTKPVPSYTTSYVHVYTTTCPAGKPITTSHSTPLVQTKTETITSTITSCPPEVTSCPAKVHPVTSVITKTDTITVPPFVPITTTFTHPTVIKETKTMVPYKPEVPVTVTKQVTLLTTTTCPPGQVQTITKTESGVVVTTTATLTEKTVITTPVTVSKTVVVSPPADTVKVTPVPLTVTDTVTESGAVVTKTSVVQVVPAPSAPAAAVPAATAPAVSQIADNQPQAPVAAPAASVPAAAGPAANVPAASAPAVTTPAATPTPPVYTAGASHNAPVVALIVAVMAVAALL